MLTAQRLREVLRYDPETGLFTWLQTGRTGPRKPGAIAGGPHDKGYWHIRIDGKLYKAHRLAFLYMTGEWPKGKVDHWDTDHGNNRWSNLRDATTQLNAENIRRAHRDNSSGLLGVTRNHQRWMAQITSSGRYHYLGTFDTPQMAHEAYVAAKRQIHVGCTL